MNNPKRKCIHVREKTRSEEIFTNLVKRNVIMKMMLIQIQKKKKKKKNDTEFIAADDIFISLFLRVLEMYLMFLYLQQMIMFLLLQILLINIQIDKK